MKKISIFLLLSACLLGYSCFKDDSDLGSDGNISKIELGAKDLEKAYTVDFDQPFVLEAPELSQTNQEKPVKYEWVLFKGTASNNVQGEVVSTEKTLNYLPPKPGKYTIQLKAFNEDSFFIKSFELEVLHSFTEGLYVLAELNGKNIVSYDPDPEANPKNQGRIFKQDIYNTFNPKEPLINPTSIKVIRCMRGGYPFRLYDMYISCKNPAKLYQIDNEEMTFLRSINTEIPMAGQLGEATTLPSADIFLVMEDGQAKKVATQVYKSGILVKSPDQSLIQALTSETDFQFFKEFPLFYSPKSGYALGRIYFDKKSSRLFLVQRLLYPSYADEPFPDKFKGLQPVAFGYTGNNKELFGVFKDTSSKYQLVWFALNPTDKANANNYEFKSQVTFPDNVGIGEATVFVGNPQESLVYFSKGSDILAYSVLSNGNTFDITPVFSCDAGDQIVKMYVSVDNRRLYVATNNSSQTQQGSIYCFDVFAKKLLWKKKNVTGRIIDISYRN